MITQNQFKKQNIKMVICFEEMIEKTKISIICEAQDEYCVEAMCRNSP